MASAATFDGKVALVTGAASGIGKATALAFAREGARVVVSDLTGQTEAGETVAEEICADGGEAVFIACDVAEESEVNALVAGTMDRFGRLDAAYNNAGIEGGSAETHACEVETWDRVMSINLRGLWLCMRAEIPHMLAQGGGTIVNCASVAGLVGFQNSPAYTASKHGVVGLTKSAALEYAQRGIRVNAVCPGVIDTPMVGRVTQRDNAAAGRLTEAEPMGRLGTAEEIADAVLWLSSPAASFVTGYPMAVDGGWVAR